MTTALQLANRTAWLAALRSGSYQQTPGVLRSGDSYCCLGVAAEVLGCPSEKKSTSGYYTYTFTITGIDPLYTGPVTDMPPTEWFEEQFGIPADWAFHLSHYGAALNDASQGSYSTATRSHSFAEIADQMEWGFALATAYPSYYTYT